MQQRITHCYRSSLVAFLYVYRSFWEFRRHFPDLADNLYASLDTQTQKTLDRERDGSDSNGTNSMSTSLRGSNSSLNSIPNTVISNVLLCYIFFIICSITESNGLFLERRQITGLRSPATTTPSGTLC